MSSSAWNIAAPSCVFAENVAENARFLAGRVQEVGLCFFEAQSCLAYGVTDLPSTLAQLPLRWHIHLPVDLPWEAGGGAAAALALAVSSKVAWLPVRYAVLHAPTRSVEAQASLLYAFAACWKRHSDVPVLLENIDICSLLELPQDIWEHFGVCLDVGHMLAYGQDALLQREDILARVALVHWSAPGITGVSGAGDTEDQHLPLTALTTEQYTLAAQAAARVPLTATHMVEVFHWAGVRASMPVLTQMGLNVEARS